LLIHALPVMFWFRYIGIVVGETAMVGFYNISHMEMTKATPSFANPAFRYSTRLATIAVSSIM
jgi:hypothetical protein